MQLNTSLELAARQIVLQELQYLEHISLGKPEILECVPETIIAGVKSVIRKNLSFDPDANLVYVMTRSQKIGKDEKGVDIYGKVFVHEETCEGRISVSRQCGRLLDIKRPLVEKDQSNKVIKVSVDILFPSIPEPRWETIDFDESDFYRWKVYSHKQNSRGKQMSKEQDAALYWANALYSSWNGGIDPEFARAKAIKHALKKKGRNTNEVQSNVPNMKFTPGEPIVDKNMSRAATEDEIQEATVVKSTTHTSGENSANRVITANDL